MALVWLVLEVAEVREVRLRLDFVDLAVQEDLMLVTERTTTPNLPHYSLRIPKTFTGRIFGGGERGYVQSGSARIGMAGGSVGRVRGEWGDGGRGSGV